MKNNIYAEFNKKKIISYNLNYLKKLRYKARRNKKNRYRICLHNSTSHLTQEMLISLNGFSYIRPHKHPKNVSESYHLIKGAINIYILDNKGKLIKIIKLREQKFNTKKKSHDGFIYRISAPYYHLTIPLTKWTLYHEVTTGPFKKRNMVNYAKFSPEENAPIEEINKFLKKYKIKKKLSKRQT